MNTQANHFKSEKFTFIILIGIMLLSLIYISGYSIYMKEKIDSFKKDMQVIHQEMNVLLEFIPTKDSVIAIQKQRIILQMEEIQQELAKNEISMQDRKKLSQKLIELKKQVEALKDQAKYLAQDKAETEEQQNDQIQFIVQKSDTLLRAKEKEIAHLRKVIQDLQSQQPDVNHHNKLSVYYLTSVSSDKKNRAAKTNFLTIQLQLKGDISSIRDKYLYIEIRDPSHKVISTENDKIRITNQFITGFRFEPSRYKFIKGKYSIRVYTAEADFQSVTFLTLI